MTILLDQMLWAQEFFLRTFSKTFENSKLTFGKAPEWAGEGGCIGGEIDVTCAWWLLTASLRFAPGGASNCDVDKSV